MQGNVRSLRPAIVLLGLGKQCMVEQGRVTRRLDALCSRFILGLPPGQKAQKQSAYMASGKPLPHAGTYQVDELKDYDSAVSAQALQATVD